MSEQDQKRIFSFNLNRILSESGKSQKEVADRIGVSPQTFNTWCRGIALPRMGKIQALADYFGIQKSDLLEEHEEKTGYYYDPETAALAQEIYDNKDLGFLMSASRKMSPEDLRALKTMAEALIRKERNWDDT